MRINVFQVSFPHFTVLQLSGCKIRRIVLALPSPSSTATPTPTQSQTPTFSPTPSQTGSWLEAGTVTTFAGTGTNGYADGVGTAAAFYTPSVAVDAAGTVAIVVSG